MEIKTVGRLRRSAAAPRGRAEKAAPSPAPQARTDRVALSRQAAAFLLAEQERAERAKKPEKNWWQLDLLQREEENSTPLDGLRKDMKTLQICQRIAARVMAGDHVPPEDLKYLMEHDLGGYQLAMASRRVKEHPKEWESALEKEESAAAEGGGETEGSSSGADAE